MCLDLTNHTSEHLGRNNVDFIHQQQSPLTTGDNIHYFLGFYCTFPGESNHGIGGDNNSCFGMDGIFPVGRENSDAIIWNPSPQLELKFPLQDRHSVCCETDNRLFDGLSCRDTRQGFPGTTRQHNDPRTCTSITKHFGQGTLLITANASVWLEIHFGYVGIYHVISKVILFHQWIIKFNGLFLDLFDQFSLDLKTHNHILLCLSRRTTATALIVAIVFGLSKNFQVLLHFFGAGVGQEPIWVRRRICLHHSCLFNGRITQQITQHLRIFTFHIKFVEL
mmetsp:Transcript_9472/g.18141  ORF Transcript_9472/g.18141 Transcript_9472/m.18141 type:complete len:279 (+) Transcript_9472:1068-1904(+)